MVSPFQGVLGCFGGILCGECRYGWVIPGRTFMMTDSLAGKGKGWALGLFPESGWGWSTAASGGTLGDGLGELGRTPRGSSWACS